MRLGRAICNPFRPSVERAKQRSSSECFGQLGIGQRSTCCGSFSPLNACGLVELHALRMHLEPFGDQRIFQPGGRHVTQESLFHGNVAEFKSGIQPVVRFHERVIEFVFSVLSGAEQIDERGVQRDNLWREGGDSLAAPRRS